jgi:phage terminase large subunit GpA-like protein
MDCLTDPDVHTIVIMKSAQVGATEVELNMLGYLITHDPCPVLILEPTIEMGEAHSRDRLTPMLRDTPVLATLVASAKARETGATLRHKSFPGGYLAIAGANSPASLASRPIKVVLADEIDKYPVSAGAEGDPLTLAAKRTTTFHDAKMVLASTPTVKGASRIETAYSESDQRRYFVPCPHCQEMQTLVWGQVKWSPDPPELARYVCSHCDNSWTEAERAQAVRAGEWRATAPFAGTAGFHLNELVSPWRTLGEIATDWVAVQPYPERLRTFINQSLGESWQTPATAALEPHFLAARAEDYELGTIPPAVALVVSAGDVQGDRHELYTWGFAEGEECWLLDRRVVYGDPAGESVWHELLEALDQPLTAAGGALTIPRVVAIDAGFATQSVYAFVRANALRRTAHGLQKVMAVKGAKASDAPILGTPVAQEVNFRGTRIAKGVALWTVGVSAVKSLLYGRLKIETPGRGYVHFSAQLPDEVYDQITSERLVTRSKRGFSVMEWELQSGRRNEALDCFCYAYAAAVHMGMLRMPPSAWENHRQRLHGARAGSAPAAETTPPDAPDSPPSQQTPPRRQVDKRWARGVGSGWSGSSSKNWVTSWRK